MLKLYLESLDMLKYTLVLSVLALSNVAMAYETIYNDIDINQVTISKDIMTAEWKTYHISESEEIALYGAKLRHFFTNNWYWGECGYGAVSGKRSGYLEGGLIVGYQTALMTNILVDCRLFTGAGGGGSAPQGGGFILHPTIGIGVEGQQIQAFLETGYITFLNGNIKSWTFGVNLNFIMNRLNWYPEE